MFFRCRTALLSTKRLFSCEMNSYSLLLFHFISSSKFKTSILIIIIKLFVWKMAHYKLVQYLICFLYDIYGNLSINQRIHKNCRQMSPRGVLLKVLHPLSKQILVQKQPIAERVKSWVGGGGERTKNLHFTQAKMPTLKRFS